MRTAAAALGRPADVPLVLVLVLVLRLRAATAATAAAAAVAKTAFGYLAVKLLERGGVVAKGFDCVFDTFAHAGDAKSSGGALVRSFRLATATATACSGT